ncbi:hypothetical protein ACLOJK_024320 [Asimina triloba]
MVAGAMDAGRGTMVLLLWSASPCDARGRCLDCMTYVVGLAAVGDGAGVGWRWQTDGAVKAGVGSGQGASDGLGENRRGMELISLMTGEEDSPRVASVINVGLRPRQIWNVLVVPVVMNDSDWIDGGPSMVGSTAVDDGFGRRLSSPSTVVATVARRGGELGRSTAAWVMVQRLHRRRGGAPAVAAMAATSSCE